MEACQQGGILDDLVPTVQQTLMVAGLVLDFPPQCSWVWRSMQRNGVAQLHVSALMRSSSTRAAEPTAPVGVVDRFAYGQVLKHSVLFHSIW